MGVGTVTLAQPQEPRDPGTPGSWSSYGGSPLTSRDQRSPERVPSPSKCLPDPPSLRERSSFLLLVFACHGVVAVGWGVPRARSPSSDLADTQDPT